MSYPPLPPPIPGTRIPAQDFSLIRSGRPKMAWMNVGPHLSVRPGYASFAVRPSNETMEAIRTGTLAVPYDTISFQVIVRAPDEALVTANHSRILGNLWLGLVEPVTVPGWLPSVRAREALAYARQEGSSGAHAVAADAIEEDGGDDFEESARIVRVFAEEEQRRERRRSRRAKAPRS